MTRRYVIVGGGVIGLSIAWELAMRGESIVLLERERFGRKASWAGAGMLIPANAETAIHPMEQLESLGHEAHQRWAVMLKQQTGIDNEFRKCGGLYLARTPGEIAALAGVKAEWEERGIPFENLDLNSGDVRLSAFSQALEGAKPAAKAVWVPGESQFSNPEHLKALVAACVKMGVLMHENMGETNLDTAGETISSISAGGHTFRGDRYIFAGGPWTEKLVEPTGVPLPMQPVRGQIALYKLDSDSSRSIANGGIVNEGSRYLVPRIDGHVLAGSTIEEVGFDCRTTDAEMCDLRGWAEGLTGFLNDSTYVKCWAGLRPATYDGFPYLGQLGAMENAYVATGHFKNGLQISTATAIVMADLVQGKNPRIDLTPFCPSRTVGHMSTDNK